jgi:hypothetical protein
MILLKKKFKFSDQITFALFSGDHNPMHIDEIISRRLIYGQTLVHGVNLVLTILESWAKISKEKFSLSSINVNFINPVFLNKEIEVIYDSTKNYFELISNNKTCLKLSFKLSDNSNPDQSSFNLIDNYPRNKKPKNIDIESINGTEGFIDFYLHESCFENFYPNLKLFSNWFQISSMLATTRIVGMECPGLNSIFTGFNLDFKSDKTKPRYKVNKVNRFGQISIQVYGKFQGTINSLFRPEPIDQPKFNEIKQSVKPREFKKHSTLIIGGSRGLGEVTAKILAAGGAEVMITYNKGKDDALKVINDINTSGGSARMLHFDINLDIKKQFLMNDFIPTDIFYFATPSILPGIKGSFSKDLFNKYSFFYVSIFYDLVTYWNSKGVLNFMYPSSVYVDSPEDNMLEYSLAKQSGENLSNMLMNKFEEITIYTPRLPRLETDQTTTILPSENSSSSKNMLSCVREFVSHKKRE